MIEILVTDRYCNVVGDPLWGWSDLQIEGRFNEPGSGSFVIPATASNVEQLAPSHRILVVRDGAEFISGPLEKAPGVYSWDASVGGDGLLTVHFAEDDALLVGYTLYPDPSEPSTNQTADAYGVVTDFNAEQLMQNLVDYTCGPNALPERQIPQLVMGPLVGIGNNVNMSVRFDMLGDTLRDIARRGGDLGWRTRQSGTSIIFEVYQPQDKSDTVRFSRGFGNLRAITWDPSAPTVTVAIVAGQGEGTARNIREVTDPAAIAVWWRSERFVDQRQTNDNTELDQAGQQTLISGGESVAISATAIDTEDQTYGVDYGLGDLVSVEVFPGVQVTELVRGFTLKAHPDKGEVVTALIGSTDASHESALVQTTRALADRLSRLERR